MDSYDETSCFREIMGGYGGIDFIRIVLNLMNKPLKYGE